MRISQYLELNKKMKSIRMEAGISQKDMATRLGLSVPSYSNYENGYSEPPMEVIEGLCRETNISVKDFFGFKPSNDGNIDINTYSDIFKVLQQIQIAQIPMTCSAQVIKEEKTMETTIKIKSMQIGTLISGWQDLELQLQQDKIDSDEYNMRLEMLLSMFKVPIENY